MQNNYVYIVIAFLSNSFSDVLWGFFWVCVRASVCVFRCALSVLVRRVEWALGGLGGKH